MRRAAPSRDPSPRPPPEAAYSVVVEGRVQGVGFRYSAEEAARRLGLSGWVANRDDGSLELLAEGPKDRLLDFIAWLHEGPPAARVDSVRAHPVAPTGHYSGFSVEF